VTIEKTVLAIDPGTSKCGLALVRRGVGTSLTILERKISQLDELTASVSAMISTETPSLVIVGSGTGSKLVIHSLREAFPGLSLLVVDEKDTSLQARERYWEHHARRGWRRILPSSLQVPPEPIDDFVAFILAERVLTDY
jgi:RNase H-fold protein (predicted Holliday junction resolvase)